VHDDASPRQFIDSLKSYPVYCGLQPMSPGWSRSFSPETTLGACKNKDLIRFTMSPNGLLRRQPMA
jgi:hypothetical protein